jgi:hypothetical protein
MAVVDRYGLLPESIRAQHVAQEAVERITGPYGAVLSQLQRHDPQITDLRFYGPRVSPDNSEGIKPGRWHVVRHNKPPMVDSYIPIETPEGGFREPDSGVVFEMQSRDTWNDDVHRRYRKSREGEKPYAFREKQADEQAVDEVAADLRAGSRVAGEGGLTKRKWGRGAVQRD